MGQRRRHRFRAADERRRLGLHLRLRRRVHRRRAAGPAPRQSTPQYRPEFAARVADLDKRQVQEDPVLRCVAPGVPRIGPPDKIVQRAGEAVFLYEDVSGSFFRIVPTDGRPAPDEQRAELSRRRRRALGRRHARRRDQELQRSDLAHRQRRVPHGGSARRRAPEPHGRHARVERDGARSGRAGGALGASEARRASHGHRDRRVAAVHRPLARAHGRRFASHESALTDGVSARSVISHGMPKRSTTSP